MKLSGWDVDLSWVDVNIVKKSTSVTIKEVPTSLECMSMIASMSDLYETRKKISIKFEVKIQQPGVSNSDEKIYLLLKHWWQPLSIFLGTNLI